VFEDEIESNQHVPSAAAVSGAVRAVDQARAAEPADEVDPAGAAEAADVPEAAPNSATAGAAAEDGPLAGVLAELDSLPDRNLAEHPEVFERIHGELHAALSSIDDA
jgi:hypothetical protein